MAQTLSTCSECGTHVRRDDNVLSPPSEQPKRLALFAGSQPVFTVEFCNDCFTAVAASLAARQEMRTAALNAKPPEPEHEAVVE